MRISKAIIDVAAFLAVRLTICVVQTVRMETCEQLANILSWFTHEILRLRHDVIEENLSHAFPHLTPQQRHRLTRRMWLQKSLTALPHPPQALALLIA